MLQGEVTVLNHMWFESIHSLSIKCTLIMNYTLKLFKNKPLKKYFFHYLKYVLNNGDFSKDFFRISPNIPQEIISPAQTVRVKYIYVPSRA